MRERTCGYAGGSLTGGYFAHRRRSEPACGGCLDRLAAHYAEYRRLKGRNQAIHPRACVRCGTTWMATKTTARFCSDGCREAVRWATARAKRLPILHPNPSPLSHLPDKHPARRPPARPAPRTFVEGPCSWCGQRFTIIDQLAAAYCSRRCQRASGKVRRGRFLVSPARRLALYERDNWTCQLCLRTVDPNLPPSDPWAATLDHIVPQSWTLIPDHSPSNLRLAHRMCNSQRGNRAA